MSQSRLTDDFEDVISEDAIDEDDIGAVMATGASADNVRKAPTSNAFVRGIAASLTYEWIATQGTRGDYVAQANKKIALQKSGEAFVLLYSDGATPFRAANINKGNRLQASANTAGTADLGSYSVPPTIAEINATVGTAAESVLTTTDQARIRTELHPHKF